MRAALPPPVWPPAPPSVLDGRWAAAMMRFNLDPAAYAHASWLPSWAPQASPRVRQQLSIELLHDHGLDTLWDWTLAEPASRLFMMDTAARQRVARVLGVAAHRDALRQVVRKDDLARLRTAVGEPLTALWLPLAEQVPRAAGSPLAWRFPFDAHALDEQLTLTGEQCLLGLVEAQGPACAAAAARARLCLPRNAPSARQAASTTPRSDDLTAAIISELLPQWTPAWTWLF